MGRSCGNRHCPTCQQDKTKAWLEKQTDRLLPCPYFLVTFTLPAELRDVARSHQRVVYSALFEASSEALRALAADPKFVGTDRLRLLRRPAHLGPDAGVSPARALRRAGRRPQRRRLVAGCRRGPTSSCRSRPCRSSSGPSSATSCSARAC